MAFSVMMEKNMKSEKSIWKKLLPFWIYCAALAAIFILICCFPVLLLLMLALAIPLLGIWAVIVYLLGSTVERRCEWEKRSVRLAAAFLCSLPPVLIFPKAIFLIVHLLLFWAGEGIQWMEIKMEREERKKDIEKME